MPHQGPLYWLDGEGWLVAAGGGEVTRGDLDAIIAPLLSRANLDRPLVVLLAEGTRADAEAVLDTISALGGPGGEAFALPEATRALFHAPAFLELLAEAGILYLGGENPLPLLLALHNTPALERIRRGFTTLQGLNLIGVGGAAATLGHYAIGPAPDYLQALGLDFLPTAVIEPHFTRTEASLVLRNLAQLGAGLLGLGIPDATALAFGPHGEVETWGAGQATAVVSAARERRNE